MPHPKELLNLIAMQLDADYPRPSFTLAFERSLEGTAYFPDVTVRDEHGVVVCVVEIGYTRPEKLTDYWRECGIPDVRWYDKAGRLQQAHGTRATLERRHVSPNEVRRIVGLSLPTIWRMRRRGEFPDPVRLSPGRVGWPAGEIHQWLSSRERAAS